MSQFLVSVSKRQAERILDRRMNGQADRQMDGQTDGQRQTDGWTNERTDEQADRRIDGQIDRPTRRVDEDEYIESFLQSPCLGVQKRKNLYTAINILKKVP